VRLSVILRLELRYRLLLRLRLLFRLVITIGFEEGYYQKYDAM